MNELGEIAEWVRTQAIPILITSSSQASAQIPAWFDISKSQHDQRNAISSGTTVSAYERSRDHIGAATARLDMAVTIAQMADAPRQTEIYAWLESLSDGEVLRRIKEIIVPISGHDMDGVRHNWDILLRMRNEAIHFIQDQAASSS